MRKKVWIDALLISTQIVFLYMISLLGNFIENSLDLFIPGSMIGCLILFCLLQFKIIPVQQINKGASFLLVFLPLFFIPSTVGIIQYPELLSWHGIILVMIVIISTFLTIIMTALVTKWQMNQFEDKEGESHG